MIFGLYPGPSSIWPWPCWIIDSWKITNYGESCSSPDFPHLDPGEWLCVNFLAHAAHISGGNRCGKKSRRWIKNISHHLSIYRYRSPHQRHPRSRFGKDEVWVECTKIWHLPHGRNQDPQRLLLDPSPHERKQERSKPKLMLRSQL